MKVYSVECVKGVAIGPCGIFYTVNFAICEVIHHNRFRGDIPIIQSLKDGEVQVVYCDDNDCHYTEYHIKEHELNEWEE